MGGAVLLLFGWLNDTTEPPPPVTGGAGYFGAAHFGSAYFRAGYLAATPVPPAVCSVPPVLLLLPPDALLYPHDFYCYREVEIRTLAGEPLPSGVVRTVSRAPCYFEEGQSQQGTQGGFIRAETDNMFTYDTVRMVLGLDVQAQDVLRSGPCAAEPGRYYRVEGNPQKYAHLGRYQEVLCAKLEDKPDWVPD